MSAEERFKFPVTFEGRDYSCERVVTGIRIKSQTIAVHGVGSTQDSNYGGTGRLVSTMESTARVIAVQMIMRWRNRSM